jgi:L-lactate dehydrogenase
MIMRLSIPRAMRLATRILEAQQVPSDIAFDVAEHLVESDRMGYASHGISILPGYAQALAAKQIAADTHPALLRKRAGVQVWDGRRGFGQHIGKRVMAAAIEATRGDGHCILTLRDSHHLGRMGHYGEQVAAQGFVLLAFTNVTHRDPTVAAFGGAQARLTTSPLCFASPLPGRPPLVLDMATSTIALNRARVLAADGQPAPQGALIDAQGRPTTEPSVLFADPPGALLPFGGHKGYALGLVAELLAGVLSGGGTIQPAHPRGGLATNNVFAVLFNPAMAGDMGWQTSEASAFIDYLLACPPALGSSGVQYPGQYEADNLLRHRDHIELGRGSWERLAALAKRLGVGVGAENSRKNRG